MEIVRDTQEYKRFSVPKGFGKFEISLDYYTTPKEPHMVFVKEAVWSSIIRPVTAIAYNFEDETTKDLNLTPKIVEKAQSKMEKNPDLNLSYANIARKQRLLKPVGKKPKYHQISEDVLKDVTKFMIGYFEEMAPKKKSNNSLFPTNRDINFAADIVNNLHPKYAPNPIDGLLLLFGQNMKLAKGIKNIETKIENTKLGF